MAKKQEAGDSKAVRVTISVPSRVRRLMENHPEEVWSRVAANAFEIRAAQLEVLKMTSMNIHATIERLKKEAQAETADSRESGVIEGKDWAAKYAAPKELRRLSKLAEEHSYDEIASDSRLMAEVESILDIGDLKQNWGDVLGDDSETLVQDEIFIAGFLQGAVELWNEVKKHV